MEFKRNSALQLIMLLLITSSVGAKKAPTLNTPDYLQKRQADAALVQIPDPDAVYGKNVLFKQKKTNFRAHGPTSITLSEIAGIAIIHGPTEVTSSVLTTLEQSGSLNCNDSQAMNVTIDGVLTLNRSKIFKMLKLVGTMNASDSIITEIVATSSKIVLSDCIVHNLTIIGDANYPNHHPILELRGASTISGSINFIDTPGDVHVFGINTSFNELKNGSVSKF